jgi:nucleotide-binding universal stress UspA family protein
MARDQGGSIVSIVVGYVSTKEGKAALRRAAEECALRKSDLIVVHSTRGGRHADGEEIIEVDAELDEVEARLVDAGLRCEVRHLVRGNEPAEDIIALAEERQVDLIVIGLRRRTPVGKLILGSNAQRILLDAPVPVLAVKADADGDEG